MDSAHVREAASALTRGRLVAFPTETVYGLGADAENHDAVDRLYRVKGRPANHPVIVHISSMGLLDAWARRVPEFAQKLARDFWPGPMTLVFARTSLAGDFITGGQDSVGVRIPGNQNARNLLAEFEAKGGNGIVAPSANRFGSVSPTSADDVRQELGEYLDDGDIILDGGRSEVGIESTIIDCTTDVPRILRLGAVTASMIERSVGFKTVSPDGSIRVSGSLKSHYAPRASVHLNVAPQPGDGLIALDSHQTPPGVVRIAAPRTTEEYAVQLYAALRDVDSRGLARVVVIPPDGDEISLAITDRLMRASAR